MSIGVGKAGVLAPSAGLVAANPIEALLPEDKLQALQALAPSERHRFYGKTMVAILADPSYLKLANTVAAREFDNLAAPAGGTDIRALVTEAVERALDKRGR